MTTENIEREPGYVYVIAEQGAPRRCKVGRTTRNPEDRLQELSRATGVPSNSLFLAKYWPVSDCVAAERLAHTALRRCRQPRKEWFDVSPGEAIWALDPLLTTAVDVTFGDLPEYDGVIRYKGGSTTGNNELEPQLVERTAWGTEWCYQGMQFSVKPQIRDAEATLLVKEAGHRQLATEHARLNKLQRLQEQRAKEQESEKQRLTDLQDKLRREAADEARQRAVAHQAERAAKQQEEETKQRLLAEAAAHNRAQQEATERKEEERWRSDPNNFIKCVRTRGVAPIESLLISRRAWRRYGAAAFPEYWLLPWDSTLDELTRRAERGLGLFSRTAQTLSVAIYLGLALILPIHTGLRFHWWGAALAFALPAAFGLVFGEGALGVTLVILILVQIWFVWHVQGWAGIGWIATGIALTIALTLSLDLYRIWRFRKLGGLELLHAQVAFNRTLGSLAKHRPALVKDLALCQQLQAISATLSILAKSFPARDIDPLLRQVLTQNTGARHDVQKSLAAAWKLTEATADRVRLYATL